MLIFIVRNINVCPAHVQIDGSSFLRQMISFFLPPPGWSKGRAFALHVDGRGSNPGRNISKSLKQIVTNIVLGENIRRARIEKLGVGVKGRVTLLACSYI